MKKIAQVGQGYLHLIRFLMRFLLVAAAALLLGTGIVYPLWFAAENHPVLFTRVALLLISALILYLIGSRIRLAIHRDGGASPFFRKTLLPALKATGRILLILAFVLGSITILFRNRLSGILLLIITLVYVGYCLGRRGR